MRKHLQRNTFLSRAHEHTSLTNTRSISRSDGCLLQNKEFDLQITFKNHSNRMLPHRIRTPASTLYLYNVHRCDVAQRLARRVRFPSSGQHSRRLYDYPDTEEKKTLDQERHPVHENDDL
jgi:hypothetical protein